MKIIITFLISAIIFSCSIEINRPSKPAGLIPKDTMILLLKDLSIIETHINQKQPIINFHAISMRKSGLVILDKYNVDTLRFSNSYDYYAGNQKAMEAINSAIIDSVNRELTFLKSSRK